MRGTSCVLAAILLLLTVPVQGLGQSGNRQADLARTLLEAIGEGNAGRVRALVARGAPITGEAFLVAMKRPEMARLLVDLGGNPDAQTPLGLPPLLLFVNDENVDQLRLLLELGADPNQRMGKSGSTPLLAAALTNQPEAARVLMEAGADPSIAGNDGQTAMQWAAAIGLLSGDTRMAEMMAQGSAEGRELLAKIQGIGDGLYVDGTHQAGAQTLSEERRTYAAGKFSGPCRSYRRPRFDPPKPKPGMSGSGGFRETHVWFVGGQKVGMITPPDCTPLDLMAAEYQVSIIGGDLNWVWECEEPRGDECPIVKREETYKSANTRFAIGVEPAPPPVADAPDEPCTVESLEITTPRSGEQFAFDRTPTGVLQITAQADASPDCDKPMEWSIEDIGSVSAQVERGDGRAVFTFRGLPEKNEDFGPKIITVRIDGRTDTLSVEVFFDPEAFNHGGSGTLPNWMYYWAQTRAGNGEFLAYAHERFSETAPGERVQGQYDFGEDRVYLTARALSSSCAARTQGYGSGESKGIDCFAELVRHETQHKTDRHTWWGTFDPVAAMKAGQLAYRNEYDADGDLVPDLVEKALASSRGCSWMSRESCSGRPPGTIDLEMNAYAEGWSWIRGAADDQDWSWCGKQWRDPQVCPGKQIW